MGSYAELDLARIRAKVADIRQNLEILLAYSSQEAESFLGNQEAVRSARYSFIVMIEAALNICSHVVARLYGQAPDTYAQCFHILGEKHIISSILADKLGRMAGFRNLLVHGYDKVDDRRMLEIMQKDLVDVEDFVRQVMSKVVRAGKEGGEPDGSGAR